jgi:alpha-beta hydrolase superfamily lysophospholipase
MTASTETLTARDGTRLHTHLWPSSTGRGTVVIVHGLGEHAGRYAHVAAWLTARGWDVIAPDLRGHGRSEGKRGVLRTPAGPQHDIAAAMARARAPGVSRPIVLLGHSAGGAFAARFVLENPDAASALVLSSPALTADLTWFQRVQLTLGRAFAPSLTQPNGLKPEFISHDPAVVRAYREDPLVHDRITARLGRAILDSGAMAIAAAPQWTVPTLLLYSGDDHLVASRGSDAFAAAAPREVVETERFDALYHEILNEGVFSAAAPVYAHLERWLEARFPR